MKSVLVSSSILLLSLACSSTSDSSGPIDCAAAADALVAKQQECLGSSLTLIVGSPDALKTAYKEQCESSKAGPGSGYATTGSACAAAISKAACDTLGTINAPADCRIVGSLAAAAPCAYDEQCQSGVCKVAEDANCGVCTVAKKVGEACGEGDCENGAECVEQICVAKQGLGGACKSSSECSSILTCKGGKCEARLAEGAACTDASCALGLTCLDSVCKAIKAAARDEACGNSGGTSAICNGDDQCLTDSKTKKSTCRPKLQKGEACDGSRQCAPLYSCIAGKCAVRDAAACK